MPIREPLFSLLFLSPRNRILKETRLLKNENLSNSGILERSAPAVCLGSDGSGAYMSEDTLAPPRFQGDFKTNSGHFFESDNNRITK